jgi:hypothetical protein
MNDKIIIYLALLDKLNRIKVDCNNSPDAHEFIYNLQRLARMQEEVIKFLHKEIFY